MDFNNVYGFSRLGRPDGWIFKFLMDFNDLDDPTIGFQIFLLLFDAKELPALIEENYKWCISSKDYFLLLLIIVLSY